MQNDQVAAMRIGVIKAIVKDHLQTDGRSASGNFVQIDARLDNRGERIENRLDNKGDRVENRLDNRGDRIENRLDKPL